MIRYLRLYAYFLRFSFSKAMQFRVDFFFRFIMDIFFYLIQFLFFNIIYLHTPTLGGWGPEQMTVFICSFIFVDAFNMTFFASNTWWLPIAINRGDLDYYLTKPVSAFFFLGFKEFAANSCLNLILASFLLAGALIEYPQSFSFFELSVFGLLIINGAFLYFMTFLIFILTVFWTSSPRGFSDVFFSVEKVFQKPDGIFTGYIRRFFLSLLPFSVMASYPVKFLFHEQNRGNIIFEVALGSLFVYLLVTIMWKRGLANYSSASS